MSIETVFQRSFKAKNYPGVWSNFLVSAVLPLLAGLILGPVLALLISKGTWVFVLPVAAIVPAVIVIVRYPFAAIMLWLAVLPLFPFLGEYKYLYYIFHRILIPLVFIIAISSRMLRIKQHKPVHFRWIEWTLVAYGVICFIWLLMSDLNRKEIMFLYDRTLVPFMAYYFMRLLNPNEQDVRRLIPVMLFLALAESVIGLAGWFTPQLLPSIWISRLVGERVVGTFSQSEVYGSMMMYCLAFLYHYAMNIKRGFIQTFIIFAFGLGMASIFFTFTRSCWVAGLIVLLGLLFLYPRPTFVLICMVVPLMVVLGQTVLSDEIAYANARLNDRNSAEGRVILAYAGQQMFLEKPTFGWGYDQYDDYDWRFIERVGDIVPTKWQIQQGTSHNSFLTILAELGLAGFVLYFLPVVWWFIFSVKTIPHLPKTGFWSWRLLVVAWLPLIFQLVTAQSVDYRYFLIPLTMFWLTLGIIASIVQTYLNPDSPVAPEPVKLNKAGQTLI